MKSHTRRSWFNRKDLFELFICLALAGLFVLLSSGVAFGQGNVGINTPTPHAKSLLDLTSTDKGLLTPRMTAAQRTAMFPLPDATAKGMLVYQTDAPMGLYHYDGAVWSMLQSGSEGWGLLGNASTDPATNFIGTTDNQHFALRTNNIERLRVLGNGNIGIGTQTPNYSLDVVHPYQAVARLTSNSNYWGSVICMVNATPGNNNLGGLNFDDGTTTYPGQLLYHLTDGMIFRSGGTERMRILPGGNIGIGTVAPSRDLEVASGTQAIARITSGSTPNGAVLELKNATAGNNLLGAINFLTPANSTVGQLGYHPVNGMNLTAGSFVRMSVLPNGNVGVNNTAPASKFHVTAGSAGYAPSVQSALTVEGSSHVYANIISGTGATGVLFGSTGNAISGGIVYNASGYANALELRTGGNTTRMSITDQGNVSIGTSTFQNNTRLLVSGTTGNDVLQLVNADINGLSGTTYLASGFVAAGRTGWANASFGVAPNTLLHGTIGATPVTFMTSNTERMRIDAAGNIGIGTSAPQFNVDVAAATQSVARLTSASHPAGSVVELRNTTAGTNGLGALLFNDGAGTVPGQLAYHPVDGMTFRSGGSERLRVAPTGEVGIGTSAPTSALEVNGYTKLGSNAPAVKLLKLTGTTNAAQGGFVDVLHGLTASKILDVQILVEYTPGQWLPMRYSGAAGFSVTYLINGTAIRVVNESANSANVLNKPIKLLVTYEA